MLRNKADQKCHTVYPHKGPTINQRESTFKTFDELYVIFNLPTVNSESASLVFCVGALNHTALYSPLYDVLMFRVGW